jgi:hypothetical protein
LSEEAEGYIPKVIANRPVITTTGHWVLPMWREDPGPADCRSVMICSSRTATATCRFRNL